MSNLNELLAELGDAVVHTQDGSYVKLEDVQKLMERRKEAKTAEAEKPKPKTFRQAKLLAKGDAEFQASFPKRVPVGLVPPSAIEGVKS